MTLLLIECVILTSNNFVLLACRYFHDRPFSSDYIKVSSESKKFGYDGVLISHGFDTRWNPVNTTTIGPKYFGRTSGVVALMGFWIKLQPYVYNDVMGN